MHGTKENSFIEVDNFHGHMGQLEYCVNSQDRGKFMDDMSLQELINLITLEP